MYVSELVRRYYYWCFRYDKKDFFLKRVFQPCLTMYVFGFLYLRQSGSMNTGVLRLDA